MSDWFGDMFGGGGNRGPNSPTEEDIAKQREADTNLLNQYLAQLVPGSAEYNQLVTSGQGWLQQIGSGPDFTTMIRELGSQLVTQQQQRIAEGGPATATESRTDKAFQGLRDVAAFTPEEQSVFSALRGLDLSGEQKPSGDIFADLVARARSPEEYYQSTFDDALKLLQDQVKARAASRGILGSGLELEDLGRTGSELAIREGQAKDAFRQEQLANFWDVYGLGQGLRNREIGTESDLVNLQLGRESRLTDLLNQNSFGRASDLANLAQRRTATEEAQSQAATLRRQAVKDAALGTIGEAAGAFVPIPELTNRPAAPTSSAGILAAQQADPQTSMNPAGSLSRNKQGLDINDLLKALAMAGGGA